MSMSEPASDRRSPNPGDPEFDDIRALIPTLGMRKDEGPKIQRAVQDAIDRENELRSSLETLRSSLETARVADRELRSRLAMLQSTLRDIRDAGEDVTAAQLRRRAGSSLAEFDLAGIS